MVLRFLSAADNEAAKPLFFVGCIVFAEPLASTLLFPFVYFMVKDFTEDQTLIGFRVGLISKFLNEPTFYYIHFVAHILQRLHSSYAS